MELLIHSNPGIYALLIGSGVSKAAGIPTGWEIVLDLIRKLAGLYREEPHPDPETWFQKKFEEPPDYARLLDRLASTPAERMTLLRSYFEPTEEEQEQGLKLPTPAHHAIASLVQWGYVRMILTTNFDRLLEKALETKNIQPDVITSDDDLQGVIPYIHSRCYVVKLHGDYRDTRLKNTPEELAAYSNVINQFLDRVFDEFGLIICGWSGEWDTALREAILRCPNRRFSTYWLAKGNLKEEAKKIIHHRRAEVIQIENADRFFTDLLEKIKSLREIDRSHPVSVSVAVATVKRYLVEPRYRILLHDLIQEEIENVYQTAASEKFTPQGQLTQELFQQRLRDYEAVLELLNAMLTTLSYHDTGDNSFLLTKCIERLLCAPWQRGGIQSLLFLQYYPALLATYVSGISAVAAKRVRALKAILREPQYRNISTEKFPAAMQLNVQAVFNDCARWVPRPKVDQEALPANEYIFDVLRPVLKEYLPDDAAYGEAFEIFEYLLSLNYMDMLSDDWAPLGRFCYRAHRWYRSENWWEQSPMGQFVRSGFAEELLRVGFFQGSQQRFQEIVNRHKEWILRVVKRWGW